MADPAAHADAAAVRFDQLAGDGQTQPGAAHCQGRAVLAAIELLEDPLAVFGGDTRAVVDNLNFDLVANHAGADADLGARCRIARRVRQQVVHHLPESVQVGGHGRQGRRQLGHHAV